MDCTWDMRPTLKPALPRSRDVPCISSHTTQRLPHSRWRDPNLQTIPRVVPLHSTSLKIAGTVHRLARFAKQTRRSTHSLKAAEVSGEDKPYTSSSLIEQKDPKTGQLGANIPWGWGKIISIMCLWSFSFVTFRSSIWRMGMLVLGVQSEADLTSAGQAAFTLFLDLCMLAATFFIIGKSLRKFRPFKRKDIFPWHFRGKWLLVLVLSCSLIPIVDWIGTRMAIWFPEEASRMSSNVVLLRRGDWVPNTLYFLLLSVCAPIWEELMFRGFLLQSLGKFLPSPVALLISSSLFAVMHGNLRQFVPLCVLGLIIGNAFVQTRNLLPATLLHSLYNVYVFAHILLGI